MENTAFLFELFAIFQLDDALLKHLNTLKSGESSSSSNEVNIDDLKDLVWKPGKPLTEEEFKKIHPDTDVSLKIKEEDIKGKKAV